MNSQVSSVSSTCVSASMTCSVSVAIPLPLKIPCTRPQCHLELGHASFDRLRMTRGLAHFSDAAAGGGGALLVQLGLAQLDAANLAAARFGQLGDELDLARVLVRRGHLAA